MVDSDRILKLNKNYILNNRIILQWYHSFYVTNWSTLWTFPISFTQNNYSTNVTHISDQGNDQTTKVIRFYITGVQIGGNQQDMNVSIICIGY